jgi:pimeloyl-ACP methyl ester carboxylesterase
MLDVESAVAIHLHQVTGAGGVPLVYREYRPSSAARADVFLVHGLASSGAQFEAEALRFARQGYRVLVPDLRGHGASGVPQGPILTADFSPAVMAADMIEVLDHAGAREVHWVGNSLGGILALYLLGTAHCECIRTLALFGTCFSMNLPAQASQVLRLTFLPGADTTGWITALTTTGNPAGRKAIAAAIAQFNVEAGAAIAANVRNYDFVANALAFSRPLLVLWGGRDHAVNLGLKGDIGKFAGKTNFRRVDLPMGGHCANFDMPEEFCAALATHWTGVDADDMRPADAGG